MILPDVNLLLYAYNHDDPHHEGSKTWLETTIGSTVFCLSWHTIMGFLRISTRPSIFPSNLTTGQALAVVAGLIDSPNTTILLPGKEHFQIFTRIVNKAGISGPKLMDAHIAALAVEHGATVATADRDFQGFEGVKVINPLKIAKR